MVAWGERFFMRQIGHLALGYTTYEYLANLLYEYLEALPLETSGFGEEANRRNLPVATIAFNH
jgi:hypothetical protein